MITKLKKVMSSFEEKYGSLIVFAVFKMDEFVDRWSLVVSSNSIDKITSEKEREERFDYLFDLLTKELSEEESASIGRIGFFNTENYLIKELRNNYKVDVTDTEKKIMNVKINGNTVSEGFILKAI